MSKKRVFIGRMKKEKAGTSEPVYLYDFSWDCGWYWGGGYLGNNNFHCHFDGCFLEVPDHRGHPLGDFKPKDISNGAAVWENAEFFLDNVPDHIKNNWWRIKDLFKQFYALRAAAEVFRHGGHCTPEGRTEEEIKPDMEKAINEHIHSVIIPEIRKVCEFVGENPTMTVG